ncbi:hypothetical protein CC86DRAFT_118849 [Ophiobolus disseminans]|uniref:ZZ-type domain-containing protein n=1 Tax=Ophiobolus disseminans TaxID=1469910 RepID=A0A6A6ZIW7_9PLEO|nr:hypothetical protein CC86DRAFT_118849 [Ophiobolus disseminans]
MASPNPNQPPHQGWTSQQYYQQPLLQQPDRRYSQGYPPNQSYYAQPQPAQYVQPYYGSTTPAPFIAELPAPLPPGPPTITSDQQLKDDELLAHRLQNLEVAEVRKRSSSAVSEQQRPIRMAPPGAHTHSPLLHQVSSLSLRPHSVSMPTNNVPWSPGSFGPMPNAPSPSSLPEVVVAPRAVDPSNDLPIPVLLDQNTVNLPPLVSSNLNSLNAYLEEHRQVPYPPTWRLGTVVATFYAYTGSKIAPGSDWLFRQEGFTWRTIRPTEHAYNPSAPSYSFKFAYKGGSFRDPRYSWYMTIPDHSLDSAKNKSKHKQKSWTYDLRLDLNNGMRKTEVLGHGREKAILTTYIHAANYDSLRFIAPDGRAYMWVTSAKVSSVNGSRYDTLRHALFGATGHFADPLYGEIVADHTFWDGYIDENEIHIGVKCDGCQMKPIKGLRWKCKTCHHHDVCEECRRLIVSGGFGGSMQQSCVLSLVCLPDEALYIRSPTVDPALVVATLQVLKDWERHTLRDEKRMNIKGFMASEEEARKYDLGIMSYWKAGDWDKKNSANERMGTMVKAKSTMAAFEGTTSALGGLVDAGFALAGHGTHGGTHGGDGGGGGSSGGGGDGGGGGGGGGGS